MLKSIVMKPEAFAAIPENPIQRNTERRARIFNKPGHHLAQLHPTHCRVSMCQTPDGKHKWKLDGHTRSFLWQHDLLQSPDKLYCDVYEVPNKQSAMEYYMVFDASIVAEGAADKIHGAFRFYGFDPGTGRHNMFSNTGLVTAIDHLIFPNKWGDIKGLTYVQKLGPWIDTLQIINSTQPKWHNHVVFPTIVTSALLLTYRRDQDEAAEFWRLYHDDLGTKTQKSVDGVFKAREVHHDFKNPRSLAELQRTRGNQIGYFTPRIMECYERWMAGKRFPIRTSTGTSPWKKLPNLPDWWRNNLGAYDHPEIRAHEEG